MLRRGFFVALLVGCGAGSADLATAPRATPPPTAAPAAAPAPVAMPDGWPYADPSPPRSRKGMVVTDAALATRVGADVLAAGGNAVDAAVATAFALAVVFPTAGNVGGGGFMVARIDGAPYALDFRETAPLAAKRDMYLDASGKPTDGSRVGYRASGVPGSVAGLWEMYQRLGSKKKTWAELLAPAIKLADEGFDVDAPFAKSLADSTDRLKGHPASAALFLPGGSAPAVGTRWRNPNLAEVLKRIAARGRDGFYAGPTADAIVAEMKDKGLITSRDLTEYTAKWRTPLELTYRGHHLIAMPPPSSGGVTVAMICHILEGYDLARLGWHTPSELHVVFEAMRRAFAARNARLGDPDFVANPVAELTSEAWAATARSTILPDKATPSSEIPSAGTSNEGPHTTHFSVVDEAGNAVALTTTLNWWFGSGVTVSGAGFLMNNEMDDFASVPGTANGFGLVQGEPNAIAPGKRMLSSMSPTIVLDGDGKVVLVLGGAGGPTIITAVLGELSNAIDFGFDAVRAVDAPRFHMQHLPDLVMVEPHGLPDETAKALGAMGYTFKERGHIADAPAIGRDDAGWIGAAEPRRAGGLAVGP